MSTRAKKMWQGVGVLALALGLLYTGYSAQRGWTMRDWSDASRQWVVCQYVRARINPYELAQRLLHDTFGPATGSDRVRLKEQRIYSISSADWTPDTPGMLPGQPPPEATYPPSTMSMLMPTLGFLPEWLLLPVYTSANLAVLLLLLWQLGNWFQTETRWSRAAAWGAVAVVCLWWPPLQYVIQNGQAGLVSLLCAWLAVREIERRPVVAGWLFLAALIKPSLVLLFFFIPLIRWKWVPIWTAFVAGLVLTILPAIWLWEWPWVLIGQWMDLCRYVLQGAFTIQEVLNALGWENTAQAMAVVLGIWVLVGLWCWRYRRARWEAHFVLLSLANLAWTYHERHDFVLLAFALVWFASQAVASPRHRGWAVGGLVLGTVLGLALSDPFYIPDTPWAHAVRWAGRLALVGLWVVAAREVRRSHADQAPSVGIAQ